MSVTYANPQVVSEPVGQYSHVSRTADLLFIAGQVGIRPDGALAGPDFESQVRQVFANIGAILASEGRTFADVLKLTSYLVDAAQIPAFYSVRRAIYSDLCADGSYPPNTLLVVDRLVSPDYQIEVEAIVAR
jgi:enamine deaminase RidA (YjgF/YER057c/UK114 family)